MWGGRNVEELLLQELLLGRLENKKESLKSNRIGANFNFFSLSYRSSRDRVHPADRDAGPLFAIT
jgi:hypothetical protein